ncbi:MAG: F0F1 ATP synthase subunit A [Planctomycetes bacterium]|nr:F0F1 ATP synthase subunit A [Planctomycetota bacterium]
MADPILHIKDGYYFEVPKALWRYKALDELPPFLRNAHPHATLDEFQKELDGKIIIPQVFGGKLRNLHTPESGFCLSKFMILELVAAALLVVVFMRLSKKMQSGIAPRGRFWNLFESFLVFIRNEVARPAIGEHDGDKFVPLLWTLFFFILTCNLLGMVPWAGAPTGSFGVTLSLAAVTFLTGICCGMAKLGPVGFFMNMAPHLDVPLIGKILLSPIVLMIFVIELLGTCIKHGVLGVRLLANMVAGHIVLLAILGLIVRAASSSTITWSIVTLISVLGSTALSCLELFVAFLQAYVFTFLSALFIGMATHHH